MTAEFRSCKRFGAKPMHSTGRNMTHRIPIRIRRESEGKGGARGQPQATNESRLERRGSGSVGLCCNTRLTTYCNMRDGRQVVPEHVSKAIHAEAADLRRRTEMHSAVMHRAVRRRDGRDTRCNVPRNSTCRAVVAERSPAGQPSRLEAHTACFSGGSAV